MSDRLAQVRELHRQRPQRRFVRGSLVVLLLVVAVSWLAGGFQPARLVSAHSRTNAARFVAELRPWPLQQPGAPSDVGSQLTTAASWFGDLWQSKGAEAVATTLAISIVAILLAGLLGSLLSLAAARNFASPQPFLAAGRPPTHWESWLWQGLYLLTRSFLAVVRALPEYVWAFLLLALLGPTVWTMILALAVHNMGILGKLTAEVIESVDTRAPGALRGAGAGRMAIVGAALVPLSLPRFLLYFFYRWETCVRESTVLGMLGMASLGFWLIDARVRGRYDELMFFVFCGLIMVVVGDLASALVRRLLRRA